MKNIDPDYDCAKTDNKYENLSKKDQNLLKSLQKRKNKMSCTRGNPPTDKDKGKIWVYWDEDTPHYIRADSLKEAWVEMFPRLSPRRWAEMISEYLRLEISWIAPVCWEGNKTCSTTAYPNNCTECTRWRPDCWMEGQK